MSLHVSLILALPDQRIRAGSLYPSSIPPRFAGVSIIVPAHAFARMRLSALSRSRISMLGTHDELLGRRQLEEDRRCNLQPNTFPAAREGSSRAGGDARARGPRDGNSGPPLLLRPPLPFSQVPGSGPLPVRPPSLTRPPSPSQVPLPFSQAPLPPWPGAPTPSVSSP